VGIPLVFNLFSSVRGLPVIDLFTSRQSAQTRRFFGWDAADRLEAIDALSQRRDFSLAYAFPPIPLLKRVVRKLETFRGTFLLVTPFWDAQTWFASLQALVVEDKRTDGNLKLDTNFMATPFANNLFTPQHPKKVFLKAKNIKLH
jgi:hypothetical protein